MAQPLEFPVCNNADSAMTAATGLQDILHEFGQDTLSHPNEFVLSSRVPAFAQVFDLFVTDGVSARWSQTEWEDLLGAIMSNDTTNTSDDVFGVIWGYFVRDGVDTNPAHAGVRFTLYNGQSTGPTYSRIRLWLYDSADVPAPCPDDYGYVCRGYSFYYSGSNTITINASTGTPVDVLLGLGIAHELQHLCFAANGPPSSGIGGYVSINETLSTLAEYLVDSWRPHVHDISYDARIVRFSQPCEPYSQYDVEKIWITYLYEAFKGGGGVEDDLVHRWIHGDLPAATRFNLNSLATLLWQEGDYSWLGGVDQTDRFSRLVANFLAAKFCNAPSFGQYGEFGLGGVNTVRDFGLFLDNCDYYALDAVPMSPVDCPNNEPDTQYIYQSPHVGCWNVRVLLPEYSLGQNHENVLSTVADIYANVPIPPDTVDTSTDYIDVPITGTDYIIFRPDPYFDDGQEHQLRVRLRGAAGNVPHPVFQESHRIRPVGWAIGYGADEDTLQLHPEAILFMNPIVFTPQTITADTAEAEVIVPAFGGAVKAVVVAIGVAPFGANTVEGTSNWFVYEYDYGVSTPEIQAFSRVDGSLHAQPDTAASGCPQGDGDEVVIGVALDPDFYDSAIPNSAFSVAAPDTAVLYATAEADSDATLIDGKYRTTITLRQFGACGAGELTILLNGQSIGTVQVDMRGVDLIANGVVAVSDATRFSLAYQSPPKAYDACADYRPVAGTVTAADWTFFGAHYGHDTGGGNASVASAVSTDATLRVDLQEENPLVGDRRLLATVSVENVEPFKALVVSLRSDHPRLRFVGWEPDPQYPSTTMGAEVTRDGLKQAFIGIIGSGSSLGPVVEFGRVEFEVLGEEPLSLSDEDLAFVVADLEVVGGGLRSFSPLRLERNEVQPAYRFELAQNVPNPFNPTTTIAYSLANDADVSLVIFDVKGARVRTLVSAHETPGIHHVPWDGTNDRGVRVSSGVYFYRLIAGSFENTRKMVLLK